MRNVTNKTEMTNINVNNDGDSFSLEFRDGTKCTGKISIYRSAHVYLCSDHPTLGQDTAGVNKRGYKFAYQLGNVPSNPLRVLEGLVVSFVIHNSKVLVKNNSNGKLFRRLYKLEGDIAFVGSVQKDPDMCGEPSAVITVMDMNYLISNGWSSQEPEESAEQRETRAKKVSKSVINP